MFSVTVRPDDNPEDGAYKLRITSKDVLAWEKANRGKRTWADVTAAGEASITEQYALAHLAAVRTQSFVGDLKDFEEHHSLRVVASDPEPDPTQPAR